MSEVRLKSDGTPDKRTTRERESFLRGDDHCCTKITAWDRRTLREELKTDIPHAVLAKKYGVSRERIRQINKIEGGISRHERCRKARAEREAKERERVEHLKKTRLETRRSIAHGVADRLRAGWKVYNLAEYLGIQPLSCYPKVWQLRRYFPDIFADCPEASK